MAPTRSLNSETDSSQNAVHQLAEEFLRRRRDGDEITPGDFAADHPDYLQTLQELLPLLLIYEHENDSAVSKKSNNESQDERFPKIPDYFIRQEIGRGGMGIVYEAEQLSLGRPVALKVLPNQQSTDEIAVQRFQREARSAAGLHHSNIVPVFEVGESNGNFYYAMQHIVGEGVDKIIKAMVRLSNEPAKSKKSTHREKRSTVPSTEDLMFVLSTQVSNAVSHRNHVNQTAVSTGDRQSKTDRGASNQDTTAVDAAIVDAKSDDSQAQPISIQTNNDWSEKSSDKQGVDLSDTQANSFDSSTVVKNRSYFKNVARIGFDVANALAYAHRKGIIHRDIKPSNLLMDVEGNLWVADFGLAKTINDNLTQTGNVVGTFRYMAPERFQGINAPTGDIYALGATLYELLTLQPAFTGKDSASLIDRIVNGSPTPIRKLVPTIPIDLETIISKAMAKEPSHRYQSAREVADDLDCFISGRPISARRTTLLERLSLWTRNNQTVAALLFVVLFGLFMTTIGAGWAALTYRNMANVQADLTKEAEENANRAQQNAILANENAARHEGLADLFLDSFGKARADRAGKEVTVYEALSDSLPGIREKQEDDPGTAAALIASIARIFESLGVYSDYYELSKEARRIVLEYADRENYDAVAYGIQVARGLKHLDRDKETIDLLTELRLDVSDEVQRITIDSLTAENLIDQQEYQKAVDRLLVTLADCELSDHESLGRLGHTTCSVLNMLSRAYQSLGNLDLAIDVAEKVVKRSTEIEGEDGFNTTYYRNSLMSLYYEDRRFLQVIPIMEKIVEGYAKELGEDHPYAITSAVNLATVNQAAGKLNKGIEICEANYDLAKTRGAKSREFRYLSRVLSAMLLQRGDSDEKVAIGWKDSMKTSEGFDDPNEWGSIYSTLAELALRREEYPAAIEYAKLGIDYREKATETDHEHFWICEHLLGVAKSKQPNASPNEIKEARELIMTSSDALPNRIEKIRNTDQWKIQLALQRTIKFLEDQNEKTLASEWQGKLLELNKKIDSLNRNTDK